MPHSDITFHHQLHALFVSSGKALSFSISLSLRPHPIFRTISKQLSATCKYIYKYIYLFDFLCVEVSVCSRGQRDGEEEELACERFVWMGEEAVHEGEDFSYSCACSLCFDHFQIYDQRSQLLLHCLRSCPRCRDHRLDLQTHHQKDMLWYIYQYTCMPF